MSKSELPHLPDYQGVAPKIAQVKERGLLSDIVQAFTDYPELEWAHEQLMRDLDDSDISLKALVVKIQAALLELPKEHPLVVRLTITRARLAGSIMSTEQTLSDTE